MVCRLMGLGMRTGNGAVLENACPIQEDFPAYRDLPPQEFGLAAWETEEADALGVAAGTLFGDEAGMRYETTIAGAAMLGGV